MSTVPFGKYKGRPVEDMLADADYMQWLEAQSWFRERFAHLRTSREELSRTPEHNRLQALFLDLGYCWAFARLVAEPELDEARKSGERSIAEGLNKCRSQLDAAPGKLAEAEDFKRRMGAYSYGRTPEELGAITLRWIELLAVFKEQSPQRYAGAQFEASGADVLVSVGFQWHYLAHTDLYPSRMGFDARIEVKPTVSDDYPVVLRQMTRNKTDYLFLVEYTGEGATEEQFTEIFQRSKKRVVFKREVDAAFAELSQ